MKHAALVIVATILTASCAATQEKNRPEGVKPELGPLSGLQTTCPVMDGKMINTRLYVDYQGFRIYVCCVPCVKAVRKNPEKYLQKLLDQGIAVEKVKHHNATENNAEEFGKQDKEQNDK